MLKHEVEGGSPEWFHVRMGIPTASCFDKLLTPKTLKPSTQAIGYMHHLLAEWALGVPLQGEGTDFMDRGTQLQDEAVRLYEMDHDADTQNGGFCTTDDGLVGCSPDRLVGEDGGLELKCPAPHTHIRYLLGSPVDDYLLQVQGSLWVTGRKWWDVMSYHPDLPAKYVRVLPNPVVQDALSGALTGFLADLRDAREQLKALGIVPPANTLAA